MTQEQIQKIIAAMSIEAQYDLKCNKICNTERFRKFISDRCTICPSGLTVNCDYEDDEEETLLFTPTIKKYGYDSVGNTGLSIWSDLGDYRDEPISKELELHVFEYFRLYEPEIFKAMEPSVARYK